MKKPDFKTFLDSNSAEFFEYLNYASLEDRDDLRVQELSGKQKEIYEKYPKVREMLEYDNPHSLTNEECAALIEILHRKDELADIEMMNVYFKGCADAIGYLRKLKMLKEAEG
ncbi:MAG: hypothetical protein LUF00_00015 [Lachnospiraceae bacterium]|nr:hypothetical protein [Lachnospiraceae bacterium]